MTVRMTWTLRTALFWGVAAGTGCKTTQGQGDRESPRGVSSESSLGITSESTGWIAVHKISQSSSQEIYLKILGTELDSGAKVPKDQMHTNKGILSCRKNIDRDTCTVRGRRDDLSLSVEQFVELTVSHELSAFVRPARGDIAPEQVVLADLECDYLGQNSPPFGVERASCRALYPRRPEEAIFAGAPAETLAQSLRGEESLGNGQKVLKGALACHIGDLEHRTKCFVRSMPEKAGREKVVELPTDQVLTVARVLETAVGDHRKLKSEESTTQPVSLPLDVTVSLECRVDSRSVDSGGERLFQCLGRL